MGYEHQRAAALRVSGFYSHQGGFIDNVLTTRNWINGTTSDNSQWAGNNYNHEELYGGRAAVNRFMRLAAGIPFSPSLGNATTTLSHPATTSHRYVSPAERRRQGIGDGLIRLSVGAEELEQIQREMLKGLA